MLIKRKTTSEHFHSLIFHSYYRCRLFAWTITDNKISITKMSPISDFMWLYSDNRYLCWLWHLGKYFGPIHTPAPMYLLSQIRCGEVDMAIGGDQGGSIRIPAAWSGIGREAIGLLETWTKYLPFSWYFQMYFYEKCFHILMSIHRSL